MATSPTDLADRAEFLLKHCEDWGSRSRASVLVLRELQQLMPAIVAQLRRQAALEEDLVEIPYIELGSIPARFVRPAAGDASAAPPR